MRPEIRPGTFVRHIDLGVGRVVSQDDAFVVVDFDREKNRRMRESVAANLKILSDNGFEALIRTRREEIRPWVMEAPLKLLAATLTDSPGRAAKVTEVKMELQRLDNSVKWDEWWNRIKSTVDRSNFFTTVTTKSNSIIGISLAPRIDIDDVPAEPLPKKPRADRKSKKRPASKQEWKKWFLDETGSSPPGRWPNSRLFTDLDKWSFQDVERALAQTIRAAREFLASGSTSAKAAAGWLDAVSRVSLRWRGCMESDSSNRLAVETGELLPQLADICGDENRTAGWLVQSALAGQPDRWREGLAEGIWSAAREHRDTVRGLLEITHAQLGLQDLTALVEETSLAAFKASRSDNWTDQIGPFLRMLRDKLPSRELIRLAYRLILRSKDENALVEEVVDCIAGEDAAWFKDADVRLSLFVLSVLVIADDQNPIVDRASKELAGAFASPERGDSTVQTLFQGVRISNESLRDSLAKEFDAKCRVYEAELEQERRENGRMTQQLVAFRAQMASGREESRLEVRQDMLLAIGDALQRLYSPGKNTEDRLMDLTGTLPAALRAGGAEPLGIVGDRVRYDPRAHHSTTSIPRGTTVTLSAPGVIVRGGTSGDRVILKASVMHQSEVS